VEWVEPIESGRAELGVDGERPAVDIDGG
jgi:hypothetical protein